MDTIDGLHKLELVIALSNGTASPTPYRSARIVRTRFRHLFDFFRQALIAFRLELAESVSVFRSNLKL